MELNIKLRQLLASKIITNETSRRMVDKLSDGRLGYIWVPNTGGPGFVSFNLLKGTSEENFTLYASHSTWNSQRDFSNWTKSEAFRAAHKNAGSHSGIYIGHPVFEGFEIIM